MYVKVHKEGNQWFRDDNGALVGTEIPGYTSCYKSIYKHVGKQIVVENTKKEIKTIYYGYFHNNKFTRVKISQKYSDKTCGYYAFILD